MRIIDELPVLNAMEPIVMNLFDDYVKTHALKCSCSKCRLDILVLTLNQLAPKYTSSQTGEAYVKALFMNAQLQSDVLRELTEVVKIIERNPHHD